MAFARNPDATLSVMVDLGRDRIGFALAVALCLVLASWIASALGAGPMPLR